MIFFRGSKLCLAVGKKVLKLHSKTQCAWPGCNKPHYKDEAGKGFVKILWSK